MDSCYGTLGLAVQDWTFLFLAGRLRMYDELSVICFDIKMLSKESSSTTRGADGLALYSSGSGGGW